MSGQGNLSVLTWKLWVPFCMLILLNQPAPAQETTGAILGTVKDATGAVLPGVSVTVQNEGTGLIRSVVTTDNGTFTVPLLPVGKYTVQAELAGFKKFVQSGITLDVNQQYRVNAVLQVGELTEVIEVSTGGALAQVDTTTSTLGKVVEQKTIVDLPLNGRNFLQLGVLQPGVSPMPARLTRSGSGAAADQGFAVNGLRPQANNFLVDGAINTDIFFSASLLRPPPDALQEFKILTNTFTAEFGQNAGSIVNILTRSDTNRYHGSGFEFLRNDVLDARNFFLPDVDPLKQNQFGGTFGGPILKDKTFFFGFYEGLRIRKGIAKQTTVPGLAERTGDFSQAGFTVLDPVTGEPFPGNRIPDERISSISKSLLALFPAPTGAGNTFSSSPSQSSDTDQFGIRIDHSFHEKNQLFGRYLFLDLDATLPFTPFSAEIPGFPGGEQRRGQLLTVGDTHTFTPSFINEFRVSYNRLNFGNPLPLRRDDLSSFGFTFEPTFPSFESTPAVFISGFSPLGNPQGPGIRLTQGYQFDDNVSFLTGNHSFRFGSQIRRTRFRVLFGSGTNGQFNFNGDFTGSALADFLLGLPSNFSQGTVAFGTLFSTAYQFYLQDDWRIRPNFTLNLGVRYELTQPFEEINGKFAGFRPGRQSVRFPTAPAGILWAGDPDFPDATFETDKNNFAPRLGFAWDPFSDGKMSVRGGFGLFYDAIAGIGTFNAAFSAPPSAPSFSRPAPGNFADPLAGAVNPFETRKVSAPIQFTTFDPDTRTPYSMQFNLSVQRKLGRDFLLETAYVGTRGVKLLRFRQINPAIFEPGATLANRDQRRPFAPDFRSVNNLESTAQSYYHSLQISLKKQYSNGLGFLAAYTLSKTIDEVSFLNISQATQAGNLNQPQNPFDLRSERGLSLLDIRQRLSLNFNYELPFFHSHSSAVARQLLGGWQVTGIISLQDGGPFSVFETRDISLTGVGSDRPDLVGDPHAGESTVERFFNTEAFRRLDPVADAGRFGNAGRNIIRGPDFKNMDLALLKNFSLPQLGEEGTAQFRAEFFNVFNHPNFEIPDHFISSPTFGRILNALDPRIIQFGLKILF